MITTPLVILFALSMVGMGIELAKSGQPKTGKHSFGASFVAALITYALLYWHSQILLYGNQ